jgi:hypothetical protein
MYFKETGCDYMGWVHPVHDRDQWRILVNMVIIFGLHKK